MSRSHSVSLVGFLVTMAYASSALAQQPADFKTLVKLVPADANAIVYIDVAALRTKQMAKDQGWFEKDAAETKRPLYLPPEADHIIAASALGTSLPFLPQWEVAILGLSKQIDLKAIANSEGGYVDDVGGKQVVWTPSDAYLIPVGTNTLAEVAPANRQFAAKWIAGKKNGQDEVSEYLSKAAVTVSKNAPIVIALDFTNALTPHTVHEVMRTTEAIKTDLTNRDAIADVLSSFEGVTINVLVGDMASANARFDFGKDVSVLEGYEEQLFTALMEKLGVNLPAAKRFEVKAINDHVQVRGQLSDNGLRRLMSLVEVPTTKFSSLGDVDPMKQEADEKLKASKTYFRSVMTLLDDLRDTLTKVRDNHTVFTERYARKIDRLPILKVDEELLQWGSAVASALRNVGLNNRQVALQYGSVTHPYSSYNYSYDGYGYGYGDPNVAALTGQMQARSAVTAISNAAQAVTWKDIEDSAAAMRQAMTKKYGVEF